MRRAASNAPFSVTRSMRILPLRLSDLNSSLGACSESCANQKFSSPGNVINVLILS